jgi:Chlamydia-phage Chp2 scaffold (Chlamy_scaf)
MTPPRKTKTPESLKHILEGNPLMNAPATKTAPTFLTPYNFDADEHSVRTGLACLDPSRTIQSQAQEADINYIVKQFGITGKMPENIRLPTYGDFDYVGDYRTAIEAVRSAESEFMRIPADIRARFENDPQKLMDFCDDPGNLPELRKLGLAPPAPPEPPAEPEPTPA